MRILPFILVFASISALGQSDPRNTRNKGPAVSDDIINAFEPGSFHGMPYRLLLPEDYDDAIRYPMVLSLHGRAGIGDDNRSQFRDWTAIFANPEWREKYPCIVVVPQSWDSWSAYDERVPDPESEGRTWESSIWEKMFEARGYPSDQVSTGSLTMAFLLVDEISRRYSVDEDRIYVLGHSMGGFGSWNAIWEDPERFAAAIPSAGGLVPWKDPARFKDVPVWAFHGDPDPVVPLDFTREIFDQMEKVGGIMKFTALGGVKHASAGFWFEGDDPEKSWITFSCINRCDETPDVWEWLFRQRR